MSSYVLRAPCHFHVPLSAIAAARGNGYSFSVPVIHPHPAGTPFRDSPRRSGKMPLLRTRLPPLRRVARLFVALALLPAAACTGGKKSDPVEEANRFFSLLREGRAYE